MSSEIFTLYLFFLCASKFTSKISQVLFSRVFLFAQPSVAVVRISRDFLKAGVEVVCPSFTGATRNYPSEKNPKAHYLSEHNKSKTTWHNSQYTCFWTILPRFNTQYSKKMSKSCRLCHAMLREKQTVAWKCRSNPSGTGYWQASTTKRKKTVSEPNLMQPA